jgi:hypothetical protein
MSKKEKVIHVDKLVIHAKEVEIIHEHPEQKRNEFPRRDPWGFWGPRSPDAYPEEVNEEHIREESSSLN